MVQWPVDRSAGSRTGPTMGVESRPWVGSREVDRSAGSRVVQPWGLRAGHGLVRRSLVDGSADRYSGTVHGPITD